MFNPYVYNIDQLNVLNTNQILISIYQLLLASITFFVSILFFYFVFKFLIWFLPNYWHKKASKNV